MVVAKGAVVVGKLRGQMWMGNEDRGVFVLINQRRWKRIKSEGAKNGACLRASQKSN